MPINTEYVCDTCGEKIEWSYHTVEKTTIKEPSFTYDVYWTPAPKEIFCSIECLGKRYEWYAKAYNERHKD